MEKIIKYVNKRTKANTQYVSIKNIDRKLIINELMKIKDFINECKDIHHPEINRILYETTVLDKNLPKTGYKPHRYNSMYSYIDGLLHNLSVGGQLDLTDKNISSIEYITTYTEFNLSDFVKILFKKVEKL